MLAGIEGSGGGGGGGKWTLSMGPGELQRSTLTVNGLHESQQTLSLC